MLVHSQHQVQFGLKELIVIVSSIALTLGVARRAQLADWQYTYNLFGLLLIPVAIWLASQLTAQAWEIARNRFAGNRVGQPNHLLGKRSILWRIVAIVLLAGYVATEAMMLCLEKRPYQSEIRTRVAAVSGMVMAIGLVVGMQPPVQRAKRPAKHWRRVVAFFGWLLLVILALAAAMEAVVIPYLVLIAMEAVAQATRYWEGNGPGALMRLSHSFLPVAVSVV